MIFKPELLWKIEHFFSVKGGEPTDLYLGLMRVAGVFFFIASIICIIVLVLWA
jgi:metal ABC transporter, nickel uptake transporter family, permease protein cbiQ